MEMELNMIARLVAAMIISLSYINASLYLGEKC